MHICLFEDEQFENFGPLILNRPVYELICGFNSIKEKILSSFPKTKYSLLCRNYLKDIVSETNPGIPVNEIPADDCLFINGRILTTLDLSKILKKKNKSNKIFISNNNVIAVRISGERLANLKSKLNSPLKKNDFGDLPREEVNIQTADYIWDLILRNGEILKKDFERFFKNNPSAKKKKIKGKLHKGVSLVNKKNIYVEKGAEIKPGTVLDASEGPIFIDKNAAVSSNSVICGPVYIGKNSKIKAMAYIYSNVSIGDVVKVGGEVEDTIMMPYSNKQHSGFIGHAYIGSWVNLGADTNCSDLKNNYGLIKVTLGEKVIDTGSRFMGLIIGDHSKSGINTMFNTGTVVGFSCNIFGSGFPGKYIPSFSWGGSEQMTAYKVEKCIGTARIVLNRRNKNMSKKNESLFRYIFELTKKERDRKGY